MRKFLGMIGGVDRRIAFALAYTAILLTVFEYFFLPARVEAQLRGMVFGARATPSLKAGLVWAAACVVGYLVLPLLFVLVGHRDRPSSIGFRLKGFERHVWIYVALYAAMLPAVIYAASQPAFRDLYPFVPEAQRSLGAFFRWELGYVTQFIALEAFFRGYLLFTLEKRFGPTAVFVMTVPYAMIHFHKPPLEAFGSIGAGIVLGFLALRFRSFVGGALLHILVAVTMDSLAAHQAGLF